VCWEGTFGRIGVGFPNFITNAFVTQIILKQCKMYNAAHEVGSNTRTLQSDITYQRDLISVRDEVKASLILALWISMPSN